MTAPAYMTRREAADWLRISPDFVDRLLIEDAPARVPGRFRFARVKLGSKTRVRILAADVYAELPQPGDALETEDAPNQATG